MWTWLLISYFVFLVSFHSNYYNFMTVVPVFYVMKGGPSQEEKKMAFNKYFTALGSV